MKISLALYWLPLVVANPVQSPSGSCTIERDTDRPGGDYQAVRVASFDACVSRCQSDERCATAQYHKSTRYCYLKKRVTRIKLDTRVDGVVCRPTATTTTKKTTTTKTTSTTTATTTPPVPTCDSTPYTAGDGTAYTKQCNRNYFGDGNVLALVQNVRSFNDCIEQCEGYQGQCAALDYYRNNGNCYLLANTEPGFEDNNPTVDAAVRVPPPTVCDSTPYTAQDGVAYTKQCDHNYFGASSNFIDGKPNVASFNQCIELCEGYQGQCTAAVYYRDSGSCFFLSNTDLGGEDKPGIDAAVRVPPPPVCDSTPYTAKDGTAYTKQCDRNYFGGPNILDSSSDIASFNQCIELCEGYQGQCTTVVYYRDDRTCFLLSNTDLGGEDKPGVDAAVRVDPHSKRDV